MNHIFFKQHKINIAIDNTRSKKLNIYIWSIPLYFNEAD